MTSESSTNSAPKDSPTGAGSAMPQRHGRRMVVPIIGVVLIVGGLIALAKNRGWYFPDNWSGALFLIPAAATFYAGYRRYLSRGREVDANVFGLYAAGVICTASFLIVFLGLSQELYGPVVLIAIGGALLIRHYWGRNRT